jgi:hypothetical protein
MSTPSNTRTAPPMALPASPAAGWGGRALGWSSAALSASALASAWIFGLYIIAFYAWAALGGDLGAWNKLLPRIYEPQTPGATAGIGVHFAAGGVILVLGGLQLVAAIRRRWPMVHRWIGRVYVSAALLAGIGGLVFIAAKGTVGGTAMNIGFSLYGALMVLCAVQAWRHARARRFDAHRAWALRLFALAIGSWLYRMEYGFWIALTGNIGHTKDFHGPFDVFMAFFFYLPNLLVVQLMLRGRRPLASAALQWASTVVLSGATAFVVLGTLEFWKRYWGPAILGWLGL